jgi:hypothetical protein
MPVTGHHLDITFATISLTASHARNTCKAETIAYENDLICFQHPRRRSMATTEMLMIRNVVNSFHTGNLAFAHPCHAHINRRCSSALFTSPSSPTPRVAQILYTNKRHSRTVGEWSSSQTCTGGLVKIMNLSYDRCAGEKTASELRQHYMTCLLLYVLDLWN